MQKKHLVYYLVFTVVFIGLYAWNTETRYSATASVNSTPLSNPEDSSSSTTSPSTSSTFTLEEIAKHTTSASCYAVINGNVYDLTSWINQHPGGRLKILALCGRDGSTLFNLQHGGDQKPTAKLATFKIGILVH